ncbi:putative transposase, Ptta/En/Spm, plant [Rosa chinensis]|uniref:Putative transposase, Ptta/En/Spm, plant n=2 Tax=Rosa chinensis TaxID=74649 RepID=A0A2P6P3L1_ROSCH|nr:putative transposase, Ptta/En/Spm, plant [Rosa chinensis]
MRMIRGDHNMTPNHADRAVNEMNASRGSINRNIGDMRSKTGHGTRKRAGKIKKKRGKNKVNFAPYGPEKMLFNKFGQPVAPAETVARFSRYVGSLAREPSMFPINVPDFRNFKGTGRVESAWAEIKAKIDWSEPQTLAIMKRIQKVVKKKLNARWRKHKHRLYVDYYMEDKGHAERFVCPDGDVNQLQWRELVLHWDKFGEKKSVTTKKNRSQLKVAANTGTKTFAQIRYEWELANEGKEIDRCTFWRLIHSKPKKDGTGTVPINDEAEKIFLELDKLEQREHLNGRELTIDLLNELFCEQFGPETYNAVRGYGVGVEWVDVPGIQTAKPAVSCDVASLQYELEASLAEITRLTEVAAKKDEQLQVVQTQLNSIETRIGNPLHSIISAGPDTIKKLIAALSDIAEKQPQSIQEMQSTPMEGYVTLLGQ